MKKLKYLILFALSCFAQLTLAQGVVNVGSGGGAADSTRLTQDSIMVYYQGGVEIGRDTISVTGTTTQPAGSNGQIQFNLSGAFGASSLLTYSTADSSMSVNGIKIWKGRWGKSANTAVGESTLTAVTTGTGNTAIGSNALRDNTIGVANAALGYQALLANTLGSNNCALGYRALYSTTDGGYNAAMGAQAMNANTSGGYNAAFGYHALYSNTTGNQNTAFGYQAGRYITGSSENTSATNSVFVGAATKAANVNQTNQIVIGHNATGLGDSTAVLGAAMKKVRLGNNLTFKTDQTIGAGQDNYVLTYDHAVGTVSLEASAIGADGNGIYSGDGTAPADVDVTVTDSINFDAGTLFIDGVNNRIGIGVAAPSEQLHISKNFRLPATTSTTGIIYSGANRYIHNYGTNNFFAGVGSGNLTTTTSGGNVGVGVDALRAITSGIGKNTAVGHGAMYSTTTGRDNTAIGYGALSSATGTFNYNNTAIGSNAMLLASNADNVAIGVESGYNMGGQYNVAIGNYSLRTGNTGFANVAIGYEALYTNNISGNTAVGHQAGKLNTGNNNVFLGYQSAYNNSTGSNNTALGYNSLLTNTTGANNVAIGTGALGGTNSNRVAIGYQAASGGAGASSVAIGQFAGLTGGMGMFDVAIGSYAMDSIVGSVANVAIGYEALSNASGAVNNIAIGYLSMPKSQASNNVAIGASLMTKTTTGYNNVAIGANSMTSNVTGYQNVAIGVTAASAVTGYQNIGIGSDALRYTSTGNDNVAIGCFSTSFVTSGHANLAIGTDAGRGKGTGGTLTKADSCIYIGHSVKASADSMKNEIVIGVNATGLGNNSIVLGNSLNTKTYLTGNVGIGTTSPSRKLHVAGEARITDLTTDTPTRLVGADADGDLGAITVGSGLNLSGGTLTATGGVAEDSLVVGHVPYVSAANTIQTDPAGDADAMAYDNSLNILTVKRIKLKGGSGTSSELLGRNTSDYNVNGITVGANLTLSSNILSAKDTVYINLIAAKPGVAVTQTAGHDYYDATFLVPEYLNGFDLARVDYAMTNSTATTGSWTVGIRLMSTTNTSVSSNGCAATFNAGSVRASSSGGLSVSKNQWLYVETHTSVAGTLDGTNEGLLATLMFVK